jgi:hypothetical protein
MISDLSDRYKNQGNRGTARIHVCARVRMYARPRVCVRDTQPGNPTGPDGKPSTGLNDNSGYSISLKRSFALVCMYDHWYLSKSTIHETMTFTVIKAKS